ETRRRAQWQQLAERRWTSQLTEWQTQMEEFSRSLSGAVRTSQQVLQAVDPLKEAIEQTRNGLYDERQRRETIEGGVSAVAAALEQEVEKRRAGEAAHASVRHHVGRGAQHVQLVEREGVEGGDGHPTPPAGQKHRGAPADR